MPRKSTKAKTEASIFKTKKSSGSKSSSEVVDPGEKLRSAVDHYAAVKKQIKHLEGELQPYTASLVDFAESQFAERNFNGKRGNFKIMGEEHQINYIVPNRSRNKTDEDVENFENSYGAKATKKLIEIDRNVKLDGDFLSQGDNLAKFQAALAGLGDEFLGNLFQETSYKVVPNVLDAVVGMAKSPQELQDMISDLKLTSFLKA